MDIHRKYILEDFALRHAITKNAIIHWIEKIELLTVNSHNELKQFFPAVDYVGGGRYVFNLKGNGYRIVAIVIFCEDSMMIRWVGTHAEYDKIEDCSNI